MYSDVFIQLLLYKWPVVQHIFLLNYIHRTEQTGETCSDSRTRRYQKETKKGRRMMDIQPHIWWKPLLRFAKFNQPCFGYIQSARLEPLLCKLVIAVEALEHYALPKQVNVLESFVTSRSTPPSFQHDRFRRIVTEGPDSIIEVVVKKIVDRMKDIRRCNSAILWANVDHPRKMLAKYAYMPGSRSGYWEGESIWTIDFWDWAGGWYSSWRLADVPDKRSVRGIHKSKNLGIHGGVRSGWIYWKSGNTA